ncbi:MAG: DNA polymerase III subunit beta [Actinomycetota bacterium]|nr:DNA polymerase III subunit beta [Actinomycetota bacterium]
MKFQTTRTGLLNTILLASRAINTKTTSLVLNGIMLEVDKELTVYSTDLETSIKCTKPVKIMEKGKAVVPARVLINILKSLKESKLEIELDELKNQVKIKCEKAFFTLNILPVAEYPDFPDIKKEKSLKINLDKFKKLVTKAQKAASIDESRAILTGVFMEIKEGVLSMVATDSYRLSLIKEKINKESSSIGVVVPSRVLDSIAKSDYKGNDIEVNIEENQISFYLEGSDDEKDIIVSRLLSGKFPEHKQLIPEKMTHNIIIDKGKLLEVVKRISSISQDNIPIKIIVDKGKIEVSMSVKEVGSSSEDVQVSYGEEKMEIAFNPEFLIDGIEIMEGSNIIISINDPLKPILIKPEKGEKITYLLMPIRVS